MQYKKLLFSAGLFAVVTLIIASCSKEAAITNPPLPGTVASASFVEEFDTVGNLTAKGWMFKNNSFPVGTSGWRQGRYEASTGSKFIGAVPFIGFPAYSANNTPNDFISCDVTAGNDATTGSASISAWLISPQLPMRNGDSISFYTRAVDDANFAGGFVTLRDRMQVRANFTDGTANVGSGATSVGSFSTLLRDINSNYVDNYLGGYPQRWTKYKIVLAGIPGDSIRTGRFAFRYLSTDGGLNGGSTFYVYPSVVGVDSLAFGRR